MTPPTWLFLVVGTFLVGLGVPMVLRKVPPNGVYGVRVPATLRDERVWYETNAVSGRDLMTLGVVLVGSTLILPLYLKADAAILCLAVMLVAGSAGFAIRGILLASRLEARYRARDGKDA